MRKFLAKRWDGFMTWLLYPYESTVDRRLDTAKVTAQSLRTYGVAQVDECLSIMKRNTVRAIDRVKHRKLWCRIELVKYDINAASEVSKVDQAYALFQINMTALGYTITHRSVFSTPSLLIRNCHTLAVSITWDPEYVPPVKPPPPPNPPPAKV